MPASLARWHGEIGANYFHKYLKTAPKTFKKYFSTPLKIPLFTLLLLLSCHFLGENTILYTLKQKYLSKTLQQVLLSEQYFIYDI